MPTLLHFTATWAERICGPHRHELAAASSALGWAVREVDIDQEPEAARLFSVLNVPAVAIEGLSGPPVVGAVHGERLAVMLRDRV